MSNLNSNQIQTIYATADAALRSIGLSLASIIDLINALNVAALANASQNTPLPPVPSAPVEPAPQPEPVTHKTLRPASKAAQKKPKR